MALPKRTWLFLILLLHVAIWFAMRPVWPFSDDYCYAYHADQVNRHGLVLTTNEFQNRIGVYLPVSILFRVFGVDPFSIALWPLIASLLTITAIYWFLRRAADEVTALIAAFLVSINILQITYSLALFPDIFIALYSSAAIFCLYHGRENSNKWIFPVLFTAALFAGILTKETIVLAIPFILIVLIRDLFKKRHLAYWKRAGIAFLCFTAVYFLSYYLLTGDAFFRIRAIAGEKFMDEKTKDFMLNYAPHNIYYWIRREYGLAFILLLSVSTWTTIRRFDLKEPRIFISIYALSLIAVIVASFLFYKYGDLFLMDRVWMPLIPPLSILSAYFVRNMHRHFCIVLIALLILFSFCGDEEIGLRRMGLYLSFLLLTLLNYYLSRKDQRWSYLQLPAFIAIACNFIYSNSSYTECSIQSGNKIKEQIERLDTGGRKIVLTGKDLAENHIIYNNFNEYTEMQFLPFSKHDSVLHDQQVFCIVNEEEERMPAFIKDEKWEELFREDALSVYRKPD